MCVPCVRNSPEYITFEVVMSGKDTIQSLRCRIIFLFSVFFPSVFMLPAQEIYDITYPERSFKIGLTASPNGVGPCFRFTIPGKEKNGTLIDFSLTGIRTVRERQVLNQRMVNTSPYIYGKVNRLYAIRPMFGLQRTLAEKSSRNSVGVNVFAAGGITLGLLKPVYMDIETYDPQSPGLIYSRSVRYNPDLYPQELITGYSPFSTGISETRPLGGISFRAGAEFNWGYYSSEFKSIEAGILVDILPSRPEIMHAVKNKIVYSSFYLSFAFGKFY